jgi:replication factor A1
VYCTLAYVTLTFLTSGSILIIMELEVLAQYGELEKIGQPEALDTKSDPQPAAISGNNFYGNKPAPAPQPQRNLPVHQSNPATSSHPHVSPIDSIRAQVDHPGPLHSEG